jgi:hypothetical protein
MSPSFAIPQQALKNQWSNDHFDQPKKKSVIWKLEEKFSQESEHCNVKPVIIPALRQYPPHQANLSHSAGISCKNRKILISQNFALNMSITKEWGLLNICLFWPIEFHSKPKPSI